MALRNVPKSYTFDQQRQEINSLAGDVGDITQLASGLPSVVAAINQLQAGSADGGELLNGPAAPTASDGANGDFWLDTSTNDSMVLKKMVLGQQPLFLSLSKFFLVS